MQEKINALYVRLVCVTDDVLREQLTAEYNTLLQDKELSAKRAEFQPCTLLDLLLKANVNVEEIYTNYRLRQLTTLSDRRTLIPFLQAFDAKLIIKDMESITINTIGNGNNVFDVYVYCLSKYAIDLQPCYRL
jgi:hypothetical protein